METGGSTAVFEAAVPVPSMHDVVIIGAGPVGLACGIEAGRRGLDAVIVEKGALVNSLVGYPYHMEFFSTADLLEIGGHPFPSVRAKPMRQEALDYYLRVAEREALSLRLYETVKAIEGSDGAFTIRTSRGAVRCRKVVVATGFFDVPNRLGVPGEDLDKVTHYYREPYPYVGQRVAVIGGKNSAAKAALECYRHGAKVTLLHRGEAMSKRVKYWVRPDLENRIKEGSIRAMFGTTVTAIERDWLLLLTPDGPAELENDFVLAMTGYRPDYALLKALGLAIGNDAERTPVHDAETFESARPGVYLAGTVCGGLRTSRWFIENGRFHAAQIMEHIASGAVEPLRLEKRHWKTAE